MENYIQVTSLPPCGYLECTNKRQFKFLIQIVRKNKIALSRNISLAVIWSASEYYIGPDLSEVDKDGFRMRFKDYFKQIRVPANNIVVSK